MVSVIQITQCCHLIQQNAYKKINLRQMTQQQLYIFFKLKMHENTEAVIERNKHRQQAL